MKKVIKSYTWELNYHKLALDVLAWLAENDVTRMELDKMLGYENVIRNLCGKSTTYGTQTDMMVSTFFNICDALALNPVEYIERKSK